MRALTLHRPWTQCFFAAEEHWKKCPAGPKRVENRSWAPPTALIGKRIALHAGEKWDEDGEDFMRRLGFVPPLARTEEPRQAVVGVVTLRGYFTKNERQMGFVVDDEVSLQHRSSPWAFGPVCWVVRDVIALPTPVFCRGMQGLWGLTPAAEDAVLSQLASMSAPV